MPKHDDKANPLNDELKHKGKGRGEMDPGDTHGAGGTAGITGDQVTQNRGGGSGAGGSGGQGGGSQGGGGQGNLKG